MRNFLLVLLLVNSTGVFAQEFDNVIKFKKTINWSKVHVGIKAKYECENSFLTITYIDMQNFSIEENYKNTSMRLLQTMNDSTLTTIVNLGNEDKEIPSRSYHRGLQELMPTILWLNNIQYQSEQFQIEELVKNKVSFNFNGIVNWEEEYDIKTKLKIAQNYSSKIGGDGQLANLRDEFLGYQKFGKLAMPTIIKKWAGTENEKVFVLVKVDFL